MANFAKMLFSPFITLMDNLKFTRKFALILVLNIVPISYAAYLVISVNSTGIEKAHLEKNGLEYTNQLRPLFEHMAQTRGMTNGYLNGKTDFKPQIDEKRAVIANELQELISIDKKMGHLLNTENKATTIFNDWNNIVSNAYNMPPKEAFEAHTLVIKQVLELSTRVYETSELMLYPSIDGNFMANLLSVRIPSMIESTGKARGLASGMAATGEKTLESDLKLAGLVQNIRDTSTNMLHGFDVIFETNARAKEALSTTINEARDATESFITLTQFQILESDKIYIDSATFFAAGSAAIEANLRVYDLTMPALQQILDERIDMLTTEMIINLAISLVMLIVILAVLNGFYFNVTGSIDSIKEVVSKVAKGDLTPQVKLTAKDEMQLIATDVNVMIKQTNSLVSQVITATNQVVQSSNSSTEASTNTSNGVNQQNSELEQIATAMNEMSATVQEVAHNASNSAEATRNADKEANDGRNIVNKTIESIHSLSAEMSQATTVVKQLETDSENIGSVLDVIKGIAEQTNLLALNAAIEAARAGEQGRGFAVVADEVRTLASRTQESTQEIQAMIEKLQQGSQNAAKVMESGKQNTEKTVHQAEEAGAALETIATSVDNITQLNEQIASAAEEQSSVAEEINRNVVNVRDIASQTVDNAKQTSISSESVKDVANQLQELIKEFKVS